MAENGSNEARRRGRLIEEHDRDSLWSVLRPHAISGLLSLKPLVGSNGEQGALSERALLREQWTESAAVCAIEWADLDG